MRAGVCAAQQTLSAEAASVLKHSLSLARRRGHAQVTPLHVAATLLSSRASLLRRACLKSQPQYQPSHPLQCRALELCFNVALNRLPATPGGAFLHAQPSLSNALIAALKRAQAHQRRGCIEQQQQQQQPLIAIKVELEQLILSILDDPSVSRVMREAGFSSTSVKNNLEDCNSVSSVFHCYNNSNGNISGGIYSAPSSPPTENPNPSFWQNPFLFSPPKSYITDFHASSLTEDVKLVLEVLVGKNKRRNNTVIVGDLLSMAENVVAELMGKVERGDVPEELKSAKLIKFQLSSVPLKFMKKEEVDMNVADLKRKVESFACGRVIIYIGDLKWTVDRGAGDDQDSSFGYSPVDHLISEIGKLLSWFNNNCNNSSNIRVWLMATANYQTYMKCQIKQPPLDLQWSLQAVSVPSGGLGLSLNATSGRDSRISFSQNPSQFLDKKLFSVKEEEQDVLTCCPECKSNYEKDIQNGSAQLPFWLKPHANETLDKEDLSQLRRKYNKMCQSLHQGIQTQHHSSSVIGRNNCYQTSSFPYWPNKNNTLSDSETISFAYPSVKPNQTPSSLPRFRRQQSCHIEFNFSNVSSKPQTVEPNLDSLKNMEEKEVKITLALGNSMYTDDEERIRDRIGVVIQENVPWQSETVPLIVDALMNADPMVKNQDKFLLIQGNDIVGKRRLALGIAKSLFGSSELLLCMNMRDTAKSVAENCEILEKALRNNDKLVVLIEDVDYADTEFAKFLADGFEAGKMGSWRQQNGDFGNAVFVLTMGSNITREKMDSVIQMKLVVQESKHGRGLLNHDPNKRKADWDLPMIKSKSPRKNSEMEEVSSNALDLNMKADDDDNDDDSDNEGKPGELSPISSDLTREITIEEQNNSLTFLKKIKNCFVFNKETDQAREMFLKKLKTSFGEVLGCKNKSDFSVEETVLEEVYQGCGLYLNNLFDQWLKDIFQTSLRVVDRGEGDNCNFSISLCLGGKGENWVKDGFMGTCLPKRIPVSFIV